MELHNIIDETNDNCTDLNGISFSQQDKPNSKNYPKQESQEHALAVWKTKILDFLTDQWSVVGVRYIFRSDVLHLRRLIWMCLVLFGLGFMVYQVHERIRYYLNNPTRVDISLMYKNELSFPTVTICNENIMDKTRPPFQYMIPKELISLMEDIYPVWPKHFVRPNFTIIHTISKALAEHNATWGTFWKNLSPFSNKRHIVKCVYDKRPCDKDNFTLVPTSMGYCLQFNGEGFHYTSQHPGLTGGLSLIVNARQTDFLFTKSMSSGFRVLVHHEKNVPYVDTFGFHATTGSVTTAAVSKKVISRLPYPFGEGNCTADPNYNYMACIDRCRQQRVIDKCGCRNFYFHGSSVKTCNPQEMYECADIEMEDYPMNDNTARMCSCLPQCQSENFVYSVSQALMSEFAVLGAAKAEIASKEGDMLNNKIMITAKIEEIKRDWAQIQVFYSDRVIEEIQMKKAYPKLQLLCDIGGAMGLILGSTVLSFFEVVDFVIVSLYELQNKIRF